MSANEHAGEPHLSDLTIQGFCGIRNLTIKRLGRVTLIAGMNGVGKTTVLDAVRVFADRGSSATINDLLERRDELYEYQGEEGNTVSGTRWEALFFDRHLERGSVISVGPIDETQQLKIQVRPPTEGELPRSYTRSDDSSDGEFGMLSATYRNDEQTTLMSPIRRRRLPRARFADPRRPARPTAVTCVSVGPGLFTNQQTQALWTAVALTDAESEAIHALNLIAGVYGGIERIAVVGDERLVPTRTIVRRSGEDEPVPLKSLGDGAVRMFGVALALANSRDGFLLIDEAENGIHHTVQRDFWRMILLSAHANNVQVLATTHGWDAVVGFAQAAAELDEIDAALVRLERDGNETFAVEYSEEDLAVVADQGIEVR